MKNIVCIYHRADFDGIFCFQIAKQFFEKHYPDQTEYIGWDYGDPLPDVPASAKVYMLDISVDGMMDHPNLNWVDHHKSAIDKYPSTIQGYRIDGVAACRLAWQYFGGINTWKGDKPQKADFVERRVTEPLAVRLAGEYDIWDKRDPRAELFQHGLKSRELTDFHWSEMLSVDKPSIAELEKRIGRVGGDTAMPILEPDGTVVPLIVEQLLRAGVMLQYVREKENASIIKASGFTIHFEGLCFLACNHARYNSHLFTAGLKPEHDACFGFNFDGEQWRISLYHAPGKEHHDLSPIAVKHGGGGHRGACGFRLKEPIFLPPTQ